MIINSSVVLTVVAIVIVLVGVTYHLLFDSDKPAPMPKPENPHCLLICPFDTCRYVPGEGCPEGPPLEEL